MESGAESASDGSSWRKGKQNKKGKKHHGLSTSSSSFSDDSGTKELGDAEIEQTVLSDGGVADDGSDGMEGSKDHSTARDLVDVKHEKEEEGEEPRRSIEFPVADAEVCSLLTLAAAGKASVSIWRVIVHMVDSFLRLGTARRAGSPIKHQEGQE